VDEKRCQVKYPKIILGVKVVKVNSFKQVFNYSTKTRNSAQISKLEVITGVNELRYALNKNEYLCENGKH